MRVEEAVGSAEASPGAIAAHAPSCEISTRVHAQAQTQDQARAATAYCTVKRPDVKISQRVDRG